MTPQDSTREFSLNLSPLELLGARVPVIAPSAIHVARLLSAVDIWEGKQWNDSVKGEVKTLVANAVAAAPTTALNQHKRGSFDGLVKALERRLADLHK